MGKELNGKLFVGPGELLRDSFRLGLKILDSGFDPKFIVGIWRGGAPPGIAVQEILDFHGRETDHISIRTSGYTGMKQQKDVRVHGLEYIVETINAGDHLLIVDDVFDTGRSIEAVLRELKNRCRRNMPGQVKIATVYFKPAQNRTQRVPDFYIHETDKWLVFPHELHGLSPQEIHEGKGLDLGALRKD